MISPSSTNPRVTSEGGPYAFRVCFTDTFQGQLLAGYAARTLKLQRVGVLVDAKSDYSIGLAGCSPSASPRWEGRCARSPTPGATPTIGGQLTRLKSERPDGLFIPGYYSDVGPLAKQARELGFRIPLLGGDGWDSGGRLAELAGDAVEGALYSTHFAPDNPGTRVQQFIARYQARFGHPARRAGGAGIRRGAGRAGGAAPLGWRRRGGCCASRSRGPATSTASPDGSPSVPTGTR